MFVTAFRSSWIHLKKIYTLPVLLGLVITACGDGSQNGNEDNRHAANNAVADGMVGVVCGRIDHQTINLAAAGVLEQGGSIPLRSNHYMVLGSNAKSMTAMLAGAMVDAGLVRWETRLLDVLPELQGKILSAYEQVTLEQLLSHRSGVLPLTSFNEGETFDLNSLPDDPWEQRLAAVQWFLEQPPQATPGMEFLYSNAGYTIAGAMLEKLGNSDYISLLNSWIFEPLGLHAIAGMPATTHIGQPMGHAGTREMLTVVDPQDETLLLFAYLLEPAGFYSMTTSDYARYLQWHLEALSYAPTALPTSYVEKLLSAHDGDYVLGWLVAKIENSPVLIHMGEALGFTTIAIIDRSGDKAVIGLSNTSLQDDGDDWGGAILQMQTMKLFSL